MQYARGMRAVSTNYEALVFPAKFRVRLASSIGGCGEILQRQDLMTKDPCLTLPQAETRKLKEENQRHKEPEDPWET